MVRPAALLLLSAACFAAHAQSLEPGEWEFDTVLTGPMFSKPQQVRLIRCVTQEEAQHPERWMSRQNRRDDDCRFVPVSKDPQRYTWEVSCPKSGVQGQGSARLAGSTVEGELVLTGEKQGQKFELRTKMNGKRVGPCKT